MDAVISLLVEPLQYGFVLRALIVSVLAGVLCPILGTYTVTRGQGFMSDALAHSVLPGIVGALLLGVSPWLGALLTAVVMALLLGYLVRHTGMSADTSIGVLLAGLMALGLLMLTLARGLPISLEELIMGQVLGASWIDAGVAAGLTVLVLGILAVMHKELVFLNFDPAGAAVLGLPIRRLDYMLLVLEAVVIVLALQAVGIVLVISLMITPAATALMLARNYVRAMIASALLGTLATISGLYLSFHFNLPAGPAMALMATGFFVLTTIWHEWAVHR